MSNETSGEQFAAKMEATVTSFISQFIKAVPSGPE